MSCRHRSTSASRAWSCFSRPHNRAVLRKGGHGLDKIPLGQVARRLALPIDFLPRHLGDFGGAVPLLQLRKQPAAFDRRQLTIVAGKNELGPAAPRLDQKLARDARVEHRRLVDDDDGALVPIRPAVLEPEQFGMHGRRARKPVGLQILGDAVGRREADDAAPLLLMRVADSGERKALAGAGAALDDFQPALARRVVERRPLILAQRFSRQRASLGRLRRGLMMARVGERPRFPKRLALLGPHRARREASAGLAGLALVQGKRLVVPKHPCENAPPLGLVENVL